MKKVLSFLLVFCLLCGTAAASVEFTKEDLLADYDEALSILEESFPCLPYIRQQYPNYDDMCRQGREEVLNSCDSAEGLMRILADLFKRIGSPAHLAVVDSESYKDYAGYYTNLYSPDAPEIRLVNDEQTRAVYASMDRNPTSAPKVTNAASFYFSSVSYDPGRSLLYLRLPSFKSTLMERDRNILVDAVREHPDVKHIVFDICHNTGGSDFYWEELLVAPFGERIPYTMRYYFRDTPMTRDYGKMESAVPVSSLPAEDLPPFVKELNLTYTSSQSFFVEPAEEDRVIHCDAKRWVLIDEVVFSAADEFAEFCRQTHWATLVGHTTWGDGGAVRPYLARLSRTGLLIEFTAVATANAEGLLNSLYGTNPDLPCKPSESPYDAVLRYIDME